MMDRSKKLAILNAASDENLTAALEAIGIDCGPGDVYGEGSGGDGSKLDTWSMLKMPAASGDKLPPITDKSALFGVKPQGGGTVDQLGMTTPGGEEEAYINAGLM